MLVKSEMDHDELLQIYKEKVAEYDKTLPKGWEQDLKRNKKNKR